MGSSGGCRFRRPSTPVSLAVTSFYTVRTRRAVVPARMGQRAGGHLHASRVMMATAATGCRPQTGLALAGGVFYNVSCRTHKRQGTQSGGPEFTSTTLTWACGSARPRGSSCCEHLARGLPVQGGARGCRHPAHEVAGGSEQPGLNGSNVQPHGCTLTQMLPSMGAAARGTHCILTCPSRCPQRARVPMGPAEAGWTPGWAASVVGVACPTLGR